MSHDTRLKDIADRVLWLEDGSCIALCAPASARLVRGAPRHRIPATMTEGRRAAMKSQQGSIPTPVAAAVLAALLATGFIVLYVGWPTARPELQFAVVTLATLGGLASAYYIGSGLLATARSERLTRTLSYPARWEDPAWSDEKQAVGDLVRKCRGRPEEERLEIIRADIEVDPGLEQRLRTILSFLEEVALAANLDVVDEEIIKRFYLTLVTQTYGALAPWIEAHREERGVPRAWCELESLYKTWTE